VLGQQQGCEQEYRLEEAQADAQVDTTECLADAGHARDAVYVDAPQSQHPQQLPGLVWHFVELVLKRRPDCVIFDSTLTVWWLQQLG
jgi:alpha-L-fucosidase